MGCIAFGRTYFKSIPEHDTIIHKRAKAGMTDSRNLKPASPDKLFVGGCTNTPPVIEAGKLCHEEPEKV